MSLEHIEILNFDTIIRDEWIENANPLFGIHGGIGIASPMIRPYLEQGAMKNIVSLRDAMRTIRDCLPEDKRKDFENRCYKNTQVFYGLKDVCDSIGPM